MNRSAVIAACGATTLVAMAFTVAGTALVQTATSSSAASNTVAAVNVAAVQQGGQPTTDASSGLAAGAVVLAEGTTAPATIITEAAAEAIIHNSADGKVLSVAHGQYRNVNVWGVTMERSDGSVIVGYADDTTGEVIGWEILKKAPDRIRTITVVSASGPVSSREDTEINEEHSNDD